ncbi:MAG: glycoside hydrolase family 3 N-terminal domain-containing protein [Gammaproteobacteria bacterium]
MRVALTVAAWVLIVLLGLWAVHLGDPHLLPIRRFETLGLAALAAISVGVTLRMRPGVDRTLRLGALCFIVAVASTQALVSRYQRAAVLKASLPGLNGLGSRFVVGYANVEDLKPLIAKGLIAGIYVSGRNVRGRSAQHIRDEIHELQALRRASGLPALIVATDQEGGLVSRLSPPLPEMPPLASLPGESDTIAEIESRAEAYAERQGRDLARLGINVNFSPVVDLLPAGPDNPLDFHSRIKQRAISADPQLTARVALAYARGLEKHGVRATLKHFPGLGRVKTDTHHFSATLETPVAELEAHDWVAFKDVARRSNALIMLSHVVLEDVDDVNPVSFSRKSISSVIRGSWKHDGILITDDLTMGAAYGRGLCTATVKALNAGVDLLLISYDYDKYYESMYCAAQALEQGRLTHRRFDRSAPTQTR